MLMPIRVSDPSRATPVNGADKMLDKSSSGVYNDVTWRRSSPTACADCLSPKRSAFFLLSHVIVESPVRVEPDVAETFFVPAILFGSPAVKTDAGQSADRCDCPQDGRSDPGNGRIACRITDRTGCVNRSQARQGTDGGQDCCPAVDLSVDEVGIVHHMSSRILMTSRIQDSTASRFSCSSSSASFSMLCS